ncbi:MAG: hypothetical protein H6Q28_241 [Bacteroidetes bacterium]|nr:hypothetical protein [Bacteroidota bacterium]
MRWMPAGWTGVERVTAGVVLVAPLVAYALTVSPSVGFIDSGELAAVVSTFGVAHPTGYPLYTLLGRVAAMLPLPLVPIQQLNALSALLCVASVLLAFLAFRRFLRGGGQAGGTALDTVSAGAGALVLAFSETFWSQALVVEVYPLHVLFLSAILYILARLMNAVREGDGMEGRWLALCSYVLGLSFGNHMTTILVVPGLFYAYVSLYGWGSRSIRGLVQSGLWTAAGLSVYAVLPFRAVQGPPFNWGYVAEPERLWWHVTGKQYRVWIFSSTEAAGRQFKYFIDTLPAEFAYGGIALALVGMVALIMKDRRLAITSLLMFVVCVAYAINYDIHDIDSYFLLAYMMVALWSAHGIRGVALWLGRSPLEAARIAAGVGALALGVQIWSLGGTVSQREKFVVEDYTKLVLGRLPENAMILSYQWDYWLSASYYYQHVEGFRPDVAVIDKELLRRSWYLLELEGRIPWVVERASGEVDAFRAEVYRFEHDLPYRGNVIEAKFVGMIRAMIRGAMRDRAVYVTPEIEPEFTAGLQRVPDGLAFRLVDDSVFVDTPFPDLAYRPFTAATKYEEQVRQMYSASLGARAAYYQAWGRLEEAEKARQKAVLHASGG